MADWAPRFDLRGHQQYPARDPGPDLLAEGGILNRLFVQPFVNPPDPLADMGLRAPRTPAPAAPIADPGPKSVRTIPSSHLSAFKANTYEGPTGPAGDMVAPKMSSAMFSPEVTRPSTFRPESQLMRGRAVRTVGPDPKRPTLDEMIRANRGMSIDQLSALAQILPKPAAPRSPKDIIGTELYNSVQGGFLNDLASAQGDEQAMRAANEARYNKLLQIYVQQGLLPGLNLGLEE